MKIVHNATKTISQIFRHKSQTWQLTTKLEKYWKNVHNVLRSYPKCSYEPPIKIYPFFNLNNCSLYNLDQMYVLILSFHSLDVSCSPRKCQYKVSLLGNCYLFISCSQYAMNIIFRMQNNHQTFSNGSI